MSLPTPLPTPLPTGANPPAQVNYTATASDALSPAYGAAGSDAALYGAVASDASAPPAASASDALAT